MVLSGWRRRAIAGNHIQKDMNADLTEIMKDDGTDTRYYSDTDEIKAPQTGS